MRYGSLCSGIGGLDRAVEEVYGAEPAWFCEADPRATSILERHWPEVPVLPDIKTQDWSAVEPVEIVTAGYPCQPFSVAGKRKSAADPRHLWPFVIAAVRVLRPRLVVLENVAGHLGLSFDVVLGELTEAGFDAEWCVVPASAAGACHRRERLFVVAYTRRAGREWSHEPYGCALEPAIGSPRRPDADGRDATSSDSGGERHGGENDTGYVGCMDGCTEGKAWERKRARPELGNRGDTATSDTSRLGRERGGGSTVKGDATCVPLLPTPTAWLGRRPSHSTGDPERWVNPERSNELSDFIAWIGASTSPPSDDGSTSSDDPPPIPPTRRDA